MRNIQDIIDELKSHPDYIGGDFWVKSWIIELIENYYREWYNDGDIKLVEEDISDEDWEEIEYQIENYYGNAAENWGLPWNTEDLEDLSIRMDRKIKIDKIINE
jgi:hypothetical protein